MELTTQMKLGIESILEDAKEKCTVPIIQIVGSRQVGKSKFVFKKLIPFLYNNMEGQHPIILEEASQYQREKFFNGFINYCRKYSIGGVIVVVTQKPIEIDAEVNLTITIRREKPKVK